MEMKRLPISLKEYKQFLTLQIKDRFDWWAIFSTNENEEIWPYVCRGLTPKSKRKYIETRDYSLLADIAGNMLAREPEGGRFFINDAGAFYLKGDSELGGLEPTQFIIWTPDESLIHCCHKRDYLRSMRPPENVQQQLVPMTYEDLKRKIWGR